MIWDNFGVSSLSSSQLASGMTFNFEEDFLLPTRIRCLELVWRKTFWLNGSAFSSGLSSKPIILSLLKSSVVYQMDFFNLVDFVTTKLKLSFTWCIFSRNFLQTVTARFSFGHNTAWHLSSCFIFRPSCLENIKRCKSFDKLRVLWLDRSVS